MKVTFFLQTTAKINQTLTNFALLDSNSVFFAVLMIFVIFMIFDDFCDFGDFYDFYDFDDFCDFCK